MTFYALSDFAVPKPSFNIPVEPPSQSPSDEGKVSACWNKAYTPFLLGAMSQLLLQATWKTDVQAIETTLGKMLDLYILIGEATSCELLALHSQDTDFTSEDGSATASIGSWVSGSGWTGDYSAVSGGYENRLELFLPCPGEPVGVEILLYDVVDLARYRHRIVLEINTPDGTASSSSDTNGISDGEVQTWGFGIIDNKEEAGGVTISVIYNTYLTTVSGHRFYVQSASVAYRQ